MQRVQINPSLCQEMNSIYFLARTVLTAASPYSSGLAAQNSVFSNPNQIQIKIYTVPQPPSSKILHFPRANPKSNQDLHRTTAANLQYTALPLHQTRFKSRFAPYHSRLAPKYCTSRGPTQNQIKICTVPQLISSKILYIPRAKPESNQDLHRITATTF